MRDGNWGCGTNDSEASRRAGGRRKYNAVRQSMALIRQAEVAKMYCAGGFRWGIQSEIARKLGVHRATVSRDVKLIMKVLHEEIAFRRYLEEVLLPEITAKIKRKRRAS